MKWGRSLFASQNALKIRLRYFVVLGSLLGSLRPPFHHPGVPLASLWTPFRKPLEAFMLEIGRQSPRTLQSRTSSPAEAKSRRDRAEIPPRTCREPSKNPPRTRRMNPNQNSLSQSDSFNRTSFAYKRFDKIA